MKDCVFWGQISDKIDMSKKLNKYFESTLAKAGVLFCMQKGDENMNLPYNGKIRITKLYGTPPPKGYTYAAGKHAGIDMAGVTDKTIHAIASGSVIRANYDPTGWGNYVVVRQDDGYNSIYAHLAKISVKIREKITAGQVIGMEGNTGNVTGSHLHLELRADYADRYSTINPARYLKIKDKTGDLEMENGNTPSEWAKEAWDWAKEKGLLDGTRPQESVTREELVAILQRFAALK